MAPSLRNRLKLESQLEALGFMPAAIPWQHIDVVEVLLREHGPHTPNQESFLRQIYEMPILSEAADRHLRKLWEFYEGAVE